MKKFEIPEIQIENIEVVDVITTSGGCPGDNITDDLG